jgi:exodeoxyribonuclease VII large subunit
LTLNIVYAFQALSASKRKLNLMTDLFEETKTDTDGANIPEFSVSSLSGAIKRTIEDSFGRVRVRGEIGRISTPKSGHLYLDLKDENAVIAAIIWKGSVSKLSTQPEEGMEVFATGRLTTFAGQSKYQLIIEDVTPAGAVALMAMLEKRRQMFIKEGLFDEQHKRPLPFLPKIIGVVTSPSGAVIQDILHRLQDRFPSHVLLWPISAQGKDCAPSVVRAIEGFNALTSNRPDVIIVARGGGSLEDLWGFNEESVVRATFASTIPIISAIGHETDTTLIDFVADRRAPTPTAAAEMCVPVQRDLLFTVQSLQARLDQSLDRYVALRRERLDGLKRRTPSPDRLFQEHIQRLDLLSNQLPQSLLKLTTNKRHQLLISLQGFNHKILQERIKTLSQNLDQTKRKLERDLMLSLKNKRNQLLSTQIPKAQLKQSVIFKQDKLTTLRQALVNTKKTIFDQRTEKLLSLKRLLEMLSYKATLQRGYAVVRTNTEVLVSSVSDATHLMSIELHDGQFDVQLSSDKKITAREKSIPPKDQGSLF